MKIKALTSEVCELHNPIKDRWNPKLKTVAALVYVLGVVNLTSIVPLVISLILALAVAFISGLSLRRIVVRISMALPFAIFMCLVILLGGGLNPSSERVLFAGAIMLKTLTAVLVIVTLMGKQPVHLYLKGLAQVGIPAKIVNILLLAYRYIFIFYFQVVALRKALQARGFSGGLSVFSFKTYGEISGSMFLKSLERSEAVHRAMLARGYTGAPVSTEAGKELLFTDWLKSGVVVATILLITIVDMGLI